VALKGDLQDISLANLIQMLCLDQRKAQLTLERSQEQGNIFFNNGQVIHAQIGTLKGADAIYHLLSWSDGAFSMNDFQLNPEPNVSEPWNHLLMEGMRLIDEQNSFEAQDLDRGHNGYTPPTPAQIEQDDELENSFILLLSNLEQAQAQLGQAKKDKQATAALQHLTEIINELAAFTEKSLADTALHLSQMIAVAAKSYSTTRLLRVRQNRLSIDVLVKLHESWTGTISERQQTFKEICLSQAMIIQEYLLHLVDQFHVDTTADQWRETCNIFLTELNQKISAIQF
jgi:hypothetical protein